ncbi:MAG: SIS domain-containing protein [Candidatus Atribacteria bacterium]|nr:SIS domain-containing protein [Candidatus Atribacteria bacterium]
MNIDIDLTYYENVCRQLDEIVKQDRENIQKAVLIMVDAMKEGGLIHIFGTGHSHIFSEEAFYRAGGLACINPVLEPSLMLHAGAMKSSALEDLDGYAEKLYHHLQPESRDAFILFSNSGVNLVPFQMSKIVQENGIPIIAVGSRKYIEYLKNTKKRESIMENCTVFIDNHSEIGDASIPIPDSDLKMAPTSTLTGVFILNLILVNAATHLLQNEHITPPVFISGNLPEGKMRNKKIFDQFRTRVRFL